MSNKPQSPAKIAYNQRFILRPVEPADILQIEQALRNSLEQLRVFMAWAHHLQDRTQFLERVVTQWWNYYKGEEYEMGLFDCSNGEFLAYTGFYPTARINHNCYEIGFWVSSEHCGKGYATLATQMQIILIFEYFKGDRIEITCNLDNKASLRVIEKCGFRHEGDLRNFYPQGSEQMFAQGYTRERCASLFSLIPDDCLSLPWYKTIKDQLTLFPLFEVPKHFKDPED